VPEPPAEPTTKPGDLWSLGNHRLLCGDSTNIQHVERLMDGHKADMVFTDPPYAIYGSSTGVGDDVADTKMIQPFFREIFASMALSLNGHFYVCCDWRTYPILNDLLHGAGFAVKNMIVWDKVHMGMGMFYRNTHELIITGYPRGERIKMRGKKTYGTVSDSNVWSFQRESKKQHTAQKPVELSARAISNSSAKGEIVLDLFGGSGSTLIACENTARKCRMMEMEPKYCDVIVKRWEEFTGNTAICHPSDSHFANTEDDI
jgi:DNA modification methylase